MEAARARAEPDAYFNMNDISYIGVAGRENYLLRTLERALDKADVRLGDIDLLICHHLGDCEDRWVQDLVDTGLNADLYKNLRARYGNTGHTDLPTDLVQFWEDGLVKPGSVVVLWVPGSGISLGSLVLRWLA